MNTTGFQWNRVLVEGNSSRFTALPSPGFSVGAGLAQPPLVSSPECQGRFIGLTGRQ
jgi:hypothetical protein